MYQRMIAWVSCRCVSLFTQGFNGKRQQCTGNQRRADANATV
jgi:hypothetical protein